jgi:signal transduction histidine kinase
VTPLGKVVRTTAFRLSAIYIAVFSIFSVFFITYIAYSTNIILNNQVRDEIATELLGLADQYRIGGLPAVLQAIDQRAYRPGASLYLLTDVSGRILAGNVAEVPSDIINRAGVDPVTVSYRRYAGDVVQGTAMVQVVRIPSGFIVLVGRDLSEREAFRDVIGSSLAWALALMIGLALLSWVFVSRRVLKRIDSLSATSRRIMSGDLSGRLEVIGTGDEFDRLADSLNAMLDRIQELLYGLKDVSDNIAHYLKTPLSRLRNRVETALAGSGDVDSYRATLVSTIEESDALIRTFNALLMIARVEAGSPDGIWEDVDASTVVRDVAELYEPSAEEKGIALTVDAPAPIRLKASRELLGQVVANLIDNAIKYGMPETSERKPRIAISARQEGGDAVLSIADNGPGVPEADRARVLQRFVRLEKSRSEAGSGLGLSLVAAVVRLHHGTIQLGDAMPGLIVTIRLPNKAE